AVTSLDDGHGNTLSSGTLTTATLTNLDLNVGVGPVGFGVTGGGILVASLTPTASSDHRSWTAVKADLSAGKFQVTGLLLTATSLVVELNEAGTGATPLDWAVAFPSGGLSVVAASFKKKTNAYPG